MASNMNGIWGVEITQMVTGIIPKWGRTSRYVLARLADVSGQDLQGVIEVLRGAKEHLSHNPEEAEAYLRSLHERGFNGFSLSPDRKREGHPDRVGLRRLNFVIDGIDVRIEGDEPHNGSTLIRLDEADFAFTGLDELLIHNQQWMHENGKHVRSWGNHNYQLKAPTDVMVAGSAGIRYKNKTSDQTLQDFIGMFIIGNPRNRPVENLDPDVTNGSVPLFVKGRYEGIILNAYPNAKTVVVENVEDAVASTQNSHGVELVQTGETVKQKNLMVFGTPLFLSETLLVVNYGHYQRDPELQRVVKAMQPQGFYDQDRIDNFVDWFIVLERNLRENWVNKPWPDDVFVTDEEIETGVRPYNTKSRGWKASDTLPLEKSIEQMAFMDRRRASLDGKYIHRILGSPSEEQMRAALARVGGG